jgi:hypothetical protein
MLVIGDVAPLEHVWLQFPVIAVFQVIFIMNLSAS